MIYYFIERYFGNDEFHLESKVEMVKEKANNQRSVKGILRVLNRSTLLKKSKRIKVGNWFSNDHNKKVYENVLGHFINIF